MKEDVIEKKCRVEVVVVPELSEWSVLWPQVVLEIVCSSAH